MIVFQKEESKRSGTKLLERWDKKRMIVEEQFKYLVQAVGCVGLNMDMDQLFWELPWDRVALDKLIEAEKLKLNEKLADKSSNVKKRYSGLGNFGNTPTYNSKFSNSLLVPRPGQILYSTDTSSQRSINKPKISSSILSNEKMKKIQKRGQFYSSLPPAYTHVWKEGFVWKGLFLQLISRLQADVLKEKFRNLREFHKVSQLSEATYRDWNGARLFQTASMHHIIEYGTYCLYATPIIVGPHSLAKSTDGSLSHQIDSRTDRRLHQAVHLEQGSLPGPKRGLLLVIKVSNVTEGVSTNLFYYNPVSRSCIFDRTVFTDVPHETLGSGLAGEKVREYFSQRAFEASSDQHDHISIY